MASRYKLDGLQTYILWSKGKAVSGCDYAASLANKLGKRSLETCLEATALNLSIGEKALSVVSPRLGYCKIKAKAILLACGAREKTRTERGRIFGKRPARVYNSLQMLELMWKSPDWLPTRFQILGSEVISFALAKRLARSRHHRDLPFMIDFDAKYGTSIFSIFFFRQWASPRSNASLHQLIIRGNQGVESLDLVNGHTRTLPTDYLVITGKLVPNTELLASAGLPIEPNTREIPNRAVSELNRRGIFLTGNITGTSYGGERTFLSGYLGAGKVIEYLKKNEK
jgi:hypothetical protein